MHLLYYLLARILLILLTTFIFPETWFRGFVQSYRRYLIIISISYFTYYYYQYEEEKKFQYLRNALLVFNSYLTLHLFLRPLLHIEPALFLLLGCIILGLRYISKTHIKYKSPFYTLGGIFSFLILFSGIFYLYPEAPDIQGFINQQKTQLLLISPNTLPKYLAYIKFTNSLTQKQQEYLFQTWTQEFPLPDQYQLDYISSTLDNPAQTFILFPDGKLLQIFPQTTLHSQNNSTTERGNLARHPALRTGTTTATPSKEETLIPITTYQIITTSYRTNLQFHLIKQMGSSFLANSTIQQINKSALHFLAKIFPGFFSPNIKNYEQFAYYFSLFNQTESLFATEKYSVSKTLDTKETNLFQQIKRNIQLSIPNLQFF